MISISSAAAQEIRRIQVSQRKPNSNLRIEVRAGGCSGFFYTLELSETIAAGDCVEESGGVSVLLAEDSCQYIEGLRLDYTEDLMGGGFRFYNPNASASCSCGLSFALVSSPTS